MKFHFPGFGILTAIALDIGFFIFILFNWGLIDSAAKHILQRLANI